tara:strand:+ start:309 stop:482 length:174 start_codon:yes stop_codon:yes gene_type:complete
MKEERWTVPLLAKEFNIPESTIVKWKYNEAIPRREQVLQIYEFTNKKVTPNDFYGIS